LAIDVKVSVSGDELREIPKRLRDIVTPRFMEVSTEFLQSRMLTYMPVKTGEMMMSLTTRRWGNQYGYWASVGPTAPYSLLVSLGTAPHDIYPVNARALHWTGPGGEVFARHVKHPGTQPNLFMEKARLDYQEELDNLWLIAWEEEFKSERL
jgi:hypothetical protein